MPHGPAVLSGKSREEGKGKHLQGASRSAQHSHGFVSWWFLCGLWPDGPLDLGSSTILMKATRKKTINLCMWPEFRSLVWLSLLHPTADNLWSSHLTCELSFRNLLGSEITPGGWDVPGTPWRIVRIAMKSVVIKWLLWLSEGTYILSIEVGLQDASFSGLQSQCINKKLCEVIENTTVWEREDWSNFYRIFTIICEQHF